MAFTVEDGTGLVDSNSFATVQEAKDFADERGFTLPTADADVQKLLIKACDYLLGMESQYKGQRSNENQRLPFPRVNVVLYGTDYIEEDEIPDRLKEAQIRLAISANSTELVPDGKGQEIKREKLGPLENEYFERGTGTVTPQFNQAMDLLRPFLKSGGLGLGSISLERY